MERVKRYLYSDDRTVKVYYSQSVALQSSCSQVGAVVALLCSGVAGALQLCCSCAEIALQLCRFAVGL